MAAGAHDILLQAECILTSVPPSVPWPVQNSVNTNVRSNQPKDARQGIKQVEYNPKKILLLIQGYCSLICCMIVCLLGSYLPFFVLDYMGKSLKQSRV